MKRIILLIYILALDCNAKNHIFDETLNMKPSTNILSLAYDEDLEHQKRIDLYKAVALNRAIENRLKKILVPVDQTKSNLNSPEKIDHIDLSLNNEEVASVNIEDINLTAKTFVEKLELVLEKKHKQKRLREFLIHSLISLAAIFTAFILGMTFAYEVGSEAMKFHTRKIIKFFKKIFKMGA